jgi:hypothetical protein
MSGATGVVTFNFNTFGALFPELLSLVNATQAQAYFNRACLQLDNSTTSIIQDATPGGMRETLLYLLVAHLATLGQRDANQVGRISDAAQGTVHVAFESAPAIGTSAWFMQTRYGAEYWQATAVYRTFQPIPTWQPFGLPYPTP